MANDQFEMYRVIPAAGWGAVQTAPGVTAAQIASLTTYMREVLYEAMGIAAEEARATSSLNSRTGRLFNAIKTGRRPRGSGRPETVSCTFLFRPWMAIHETGGTIVPTNKRYLTLPMPGAIRADGALKRRSPLGWKSYGSFVYTSRRTGKKFIVYRSKTAGELVFLYYLADRVTMSRKLFLREAILRQEQAVVAAWSNAVMEIYTSVDLYGIAIEGRAP